jgi:hypothetical protein
MPTTMGPAGARTVNLGGVANNRSLDITHFERTNPRLPQVIQQHPGLQAFLVKHASNIASGSSPSPTKIIWNAWFHSPASLRQDYNWKDQLIFAFQRSPKNQGTIDFGNQGRYQGLLIGVHRMGDLDVPVRMRGKFEGGSSADGGFETQFMVEAVGNRGDDVEVCFCVGTLDAKGQAVGGWGTLGGYGGRQHDITIGVPDQVPIHEDNGSFSILVPRTGGGFLSKPA